MTDTPIDASNLPFLIGIASPTLASDCSDQRPLVASQRTAIAAPLLPSGLATFSTADPRPSGFEAAPVAGASSPALDLADQRPPPTFGASSHHDAAWLHALSDPTAPPAHLPTMMATGVAPGMGFMPHGASYPAMGMPNGVGAASTSSSILCSRWEDAAGDRSTSTFNGDDEGDGSFDQSYDQSFGPDGGFGGEMQDQRVLIARKAQEAASAEGASGIFACPYCDKSYGGKHARSIWRRHLQDKHNIPLSQQPRRTRWDGDANRPKNAEERRQRMLESKRRWARKKRMMERAGIEGTPASLEAQERSKREASGSVAPNGSSDNGGSEPPRSRGSRQMESFDEAFEAAASQARAHRAGSLGQQQQQPFLQQPLPMPPQQHPFAYDPHGIYGAPPGMVPGPMVGMPPGPVPGAGGEFPPQGPPTYTMMAAAAPMPRRALAQIDSNARPSPSRRQSALAQIDSNARPSPSRRQNDKGAGLVPIADGSATPGSKTPQSRLVDLPPPPNGLSAPLPPRESPGATHLRGLRGGDVHLMPSPTRATLLKSSHSPHALRAAATSDVMLGGPETLRASPSKSRTLPGLEQDVHRTPMSAKRASALTTSGSNPFSLDQHKVSPSTATRPLPLLGRGASSLEMESPARGLGTNGSIRKLPPLLSTPLRPGLGDEDGGLLGLSFGSTRKPLLPKAGSRSGKETPGLDDIGEDSYFSSGLLSKGGLGKPLGSALMGQTPFKKLSAGTPLRKPMGAPTPRAGLKRGDSGDDDGRNGADQFSSPQHLNLTQSLGLAPSSVARTSFGYGTGATPFSASTAAFGASPWPDSAVRPSRYLGGRDDDDDDDDDDEDASHAAASRFLAETPSRPSGAGASSLKRGAPSTRDGGGKALSVIASQDGSSAKSRRTSVISPFSFHVRSTERGSPSARSSRAGAPGSVAASMGTPLGNGGASPASRKRESSVRSLLVASPSPGKSLLGSARKAAGRSSADDDVYDDDDDEGSPSASQQPERGAARRLFDTSPGANKTLKRALDEEDNVGPPVKMASKTAPRLASPVNDQENIPAALASSSAGSSP